MGILNFLLRQVLETYAYDASAESSSDTPTASRGRSRNHIYEFTVSRDASVRFL